MITHYKRGRCNHYNIEPNMVIYESCCKKQCPVLQFCIDVRTVNKARFFNLFFMITRCHHGAEFCITKILKSRCGSLLKLNFYGLGARKMLPHVNFHMHRAKKTVVCVTFVRNLASLRLTLSRSKYPSFCSSLFASVKKYVANLVFAQTWFSRGWRI